jgi:hypothetical protein
MKKNNIKLTHSSRNDFGKLILFLLFGFYFFLSCNNDAPVPVKLPDDTVKIEKSKKTDKAILNKKKKNEPCAFDMKQQTDAFLKDKPQYTSYKWNNQLKEARILLNNNEDTLIIHRGGCHYFEFSIHLISMTQKGALLRKRFFYKGRL